MSCTKHPSMLPSYAAWLVRERMLRLDWATYDVPSLEADAVVFLVGLGPLSPSPHPPT